MTRRWVILVGLAALTVALALLLRDVVATTLAPFLARWLNSLLTIVLGLPPTVIWLLFVLLAAFSLLFGLLQLAIWLANRPLRRQPDQVVHTPGPVEELTRWIGQSGDGPLFQQRLARRLARCALEAWGYGEVAALREMQAHLMERASTTPPPIMAYLRLGVERLEIETVTTSPSVLPQLRARRPTPDPLLTSIVAFLEDNLEA